MRIILMLLAAGFALPAWAATLSVTPPTKNTDGSSIPATGPGSIASVRVEYGTCNGNAFGAKAGELNMAAPNLTGLLSLPPAIYCFRGYAKNTYGAESAATAVLVYEVKPPVPGVATITITAEPAP